MTQRSGRASPDSAGPFTSISKVSPTQQVRDQLLAAIERGDYAAGEMLPSERVLCEMFGVSRVSVREAIAGLQAMGVVEVQHGRGCLVAPSIADRFSGPFGVWLHVHKHEMLDLLKVRGALDELAAHDAAVRGDKRSLARVQKAHKAFRKEADAQDQDLQRLIGLDVEFHDAIAAASGSQLLADLLSELAHHTADSREITLAPEGQPARSGDQHEAILSRVLAGDGNGAREAAREHVRSVREWIDAHA